MECVLKERFEAWVGRLEMHRIGISFSTSHDITLPSFSRKMTSCSHYSYARGKFGLSESSNWNHMVLLPVTDSVLDSTAQALRSASSLWHAQWIWRLTFEYMPRGLSPYCNNNAETKEESMRLCFTMDDADLRVSTAFTKNECCMIVERYGHIFIPSVLSSHIFVIIVAILLNSVMTILR